MMPVYEFSVFAASDGTYRVYFEGLAADLFGAGMCFEEYETLGASQDALSGYADDYYDEYGTLASRAPDVY